MAKRPLLAPLLLSGVLACGAHPHPGQVQFPGPALSAITYRAQVVATEPWLLDVTMTLIGGADALTPPAASSLLALSITDARGTRSPPLHTRPLRIACPTTCQVHYRLDLTAAARASGDDLSLAARSGPDLLAPASTWLLRPEPLIPHLPVQLTVDPGPAVDFAAGLHRRGPRGDFALQSEDLETAGYTAFGKLSRVEVPVSDGALELVILGGRRAASDALLGRWAGTMARAIEGLYGRFPVSRATIFLLPAPGFARVRSGVTVPAGGPSILLVLGENAGEAALRDDWVLAHELFHLGVPSFFGEGRWLEEGLATYYEPVLRTRAGLRSDASLWSEFAREMPRGLRLSGETNLAFTQDHDRTYWGGATFALAADVLIRARTGGARSLDDGLRAALARGADATQVWSVASFFRVIDEAVGVQATQELYAIAAGIVGCSDGPSTARARRPGGLELFPACLPEAQGDLDQLFQWLGVEPTRAGLVTFHADAPLASVRERIGQAARPHGVPMTWPIP